jgi:benzoate membrane transport protein
MPIERPASRPPSLRELLTDFGPIYSANGLIGFIFAATGPLAILMSVGSQGGLSQAQIASWVFGCFGINGVLSILASWYYRMPLTFFWTIPGAVLVGSALSHLSFAQVVGAYLACGVLMLVLGLSGWVRRLMQALPMPIVMGMVAGVFMRFGVDLIYALRDDLALAGPMVLTFVLMSVLPLGRRFPPLFAAILVGVVIIVAQGSFDVSGMRGAAFAQPVFQRPEFAWQAMFELVVPLAITVLIVQNGQGFAVLDAVGHKAPINMATIGCGAWSLLTACVGSVSTCLAGPTNAMIASGGDKARHYTGGVLVGLLAIGFGLFSPLFTKLMLSSPKAFIATVAGLAMLRVLQTAFTISFRDRFTLGALVAFLVTVANVPIWNIGAPFWGLVFGYLISRLLESPDFAATQASRKAS